MLIVDCSNGTLPRLRAFDNDVEPSNRRITFAIVGGSLNSSLTVDAQSGQLSLHTHASALPLYGTLLVALSPQTTVPLTVLVHDNHTDPHAFLLDVGQRPASLITSPIFYLIMTVCVGIGLLVFAPLIVVLCVCRRAPHHDNNPLMNTPSTTSSKRLCETYYSFGDTVNPHVIRV